MLEFTWACPQQTEIELEDVKELATEAKDHFLVLYHIPNSTAILPQLFDSND